ncbi:MAG: hypothetical protein LBC73_01335 [Oscillospiraceae bacterium]|nr:hypothetical protein [Oscillospiraceae bacterium]
MKTKFEVKYIDWTNLVYACTGGTLLLSIFLAIGNPDGFGLTGLIVLPSMMLVIGFPLIPMSKVFKVSVDSSKIMVRTSLGFKYSFDISEVTYVEKRVPKKNKNIERLFIRTSKKTLKLDNLMIGYDEMLEYLSDNGNMAYSNKIINKYNILYDREVFTK